MIHFDKNDCDLVLLPYLSFWKPEKKNLVITLGWLFWFIQLDIKL